MNTISKITIPAMNILRRMRVQELKDLATKKGLDTEGTKNILIEKLRKKADKTDQKTAYQQEYRKEDENRINENRLKVLNRIAEGKKVWKRSLDEYNITQTDINNIRAENGLEPLGFHAPYYEPSTPDVHQMYGQRNDTYPTTPKSSMRLSLCKMKFKVYEEHSHRRSVSDLVMRRKPFPTMYAKSISTCKRILVSPVENLINPWLLRLSLFSMVARILRRVEVVLLVVYTYSSNHLAMTMLKIWLKYSNQGFLMCSNAGLIIPVSSHVKVVSREQRRVLKT